MKIKRPFGFLFKQFLIFSPIIISFLIFEACLWFNGETKPVSYVIKKIKNNEEILFLRKFFDQSLYRFKYTAIDQLQPEIICLGTSRVMQFRKEMFKEQIAFFNGGGMIQHIKDLEDYTRLIPSDIRLKKIILGVEFWWFINEFANQAENEKSLEINREIDDVFDSIAHANLFSRYIRTRIGLEDSMNLYDNVVLDRSHETDPSQRIMQIGTYAKDLGTGFRSDGSFKYGHTQFQMNRFEDKEKVVERINRNEWKVTEGEGLSYEKMKRFIKALENLRSKGIGVILFLPPFSTEVVEKLETSPLYKKLWDEYRTVLPKTLRELSFDIIDAVDLKENGFDDNYMIDGLHAMETFHVALILKMIEYDPEFLNTYIDRDYLNEILAKESTNDWFPYYTDVNDFLLKNISGMN